MGKNLHSLALVCMLMATPLCHSQSSVKISDPRLELKDNKVHIYYDLLEGDPAEKYVITLDIKDEKGNPFLMKALEGDIGEVENGGTDKHITWDLQVDDIQIDADVFVKIRARVILPSVAVVSETEEGITQETEEAMVVSEPGEEVTGKPEERGSDRATRSASFNRTTILLQSLALPGLGLSRVTGNPHWIRGAAGYGCIAGSLALNRMASRTFGNIEDIDDPLEAEDAFHKSVRQDNFSEGLAYAAIGIWVTDIIWTWVGTSDLGWGASVRENISIGTDIDPLSFAPLVCFRYTFHTKK